MRRLFHFLYTFSWLDGRIGDILVDATDARTTGLANLDITLISPAGTPGVSDQVVASSCWIDSVSHSRNSVVDVCAASSARNDTRGIRLESRGVGLYGNRNRLLCDSSHDRVGILSNVGLRGVIEDSSSDNVSAFSGDAVRTRRVWVYGLSGYWVYSCI